jgi:hypothetical protein
LFALCEVGQRGQNVRRHPGHNAASDRNWHTQHSTIRCVRLLAALIASHPKGITWREASELSGCGRETFYRDLRVLEAAGVTVERVGMPGSTFVYRLPPRLKLGEAKVDLVPRRRKRR